MANPSGRARLLPTLLAASAASLLMASAAGAATVTRSVHDDWVVRCSDDNGKKACEAVQSLETEGHKGTIAHMAIRAEKGGPVRFIVQVPPGVWLPANVVLKADTASVEMTYKRCGQYCVASAELTKDQVTALKASNGKGELSFEDGSRRKYVLPISFKGLATAFEASLKD